MTSIRSIYGLNSYNPMSRENLGLGTGMTPSTINLPNGGGSYQNPSIFGSQTDPTITPDPVVQPPTQPQVNNQVDLYAKYRDPKTGDIMSPEEYAIYLGDKVPPQRGSGDIGQYAGDALTKPDESAQDLTARATNLNNIRNDIATGATDPYGIGKDSGIAYSPTELKAIESAYAGIYDPVLNDVFARLKTREDADKKDQDREDKIFSVDQNIRQWRETTGTKSTTGGDTGATADIFSNTQLTKGAGRAKMTLDDFKNLDADIANYYVNPPTIYNPEPGKNDLISDNFEEVKLEIENGDLTTAEAAKEIMAGDLPDAVKVYLVNQLPASQTEKNNWISWIWNRMPFVD